MTTPPRIRALTPADTDAYVAIRHEMITAERYAFLGVPGDDHAGAADHVRRSLAESDQAIFGAFDADRLVGVAGIYREKRVKRRHRAGIWGVYTTPDARGRGCSRGVVQACIQLAHAWDGVRVIGLSASVRATTAIRLYESLGFVAWGVEPDSTRVDGAPEAEMHMQLTL
jgi:RimJ/RimL family protein N-acetyltransferase